MAHVECFITSSGMEARTEILRSGHGWKAAVFLGEEMVCRLDDDELRAVIGHELVHHQEIRKLRDILARLIHDPGGMLNLTNSPDDPVEMMNRIGRQIREHCPSIRRNILALLCSLVL